MQYDFFHIALDCYYDLAEAFCRYVYLGPGTSCFYRKGFANLYGSYGTCLLYTSKQAIADGTLAATEVPFRTMQLGYEGLLLAKTMIGKSNPNAASDLGVAILNLTACIKGAWLNVKINLPGVKDEAKAAYYAAEGQKTVSYTHLDVYKRQLYIRER